MSQAHRNREAGFAEADDRRISMLALVTALFLHAAWLAGMPAAGGLQTGGGRRVSPSVSYLGAPPATSGRIAEGADIRAIRSPAVFSLPTAVGFTREILEQTPGTPPPVRVAEAPPPLLARSDVRALDRPTDARRLTVSVRAPDQGVSAPRRPTFAPREPDTNLVLHLIWLDGLDTARTATLPVKPESSWDDAKPWEASAVVDVGQDGIVRHVFLDRPTESQQRNVEITLAIRRYRFPPAGADRSGRLVVRFNGWAAAPAAQPEAAP